ncbi:unnamed protein product, partial [Dovyalis caffra]
NIDQVIERRNLHQKNIGMFDQPSREQQMNIPIPNVETYDDEHMRGENPQGLNIEELRKLEKLTKESLSRVIEKRVMNLSAGLGHLLGRGQSSNSMVTNIGSMSSSDLLKDYDSSY